jgi:hypothetical protein
MGVDYRSHSRERAEVIVESVFFRRSRAVWRICRGGESSRRAQHLALPREFSFHD